MIKIDRVREENITIDIPQGSVIAEVDVHFSGGLSPNTARHAGRGALIVASAEDMDPREVHRALKNGGHSTIKVRSKFLQTVPVGRVFDNTLQELPDGTSVQMSEDKSSQPLAEAPKPALVQSNSTTNITRREITRRLIMNVFSPSDQPANYGLLDLVSEESENERTNIIQFPHGKQLKTAA